MPIFIEGHTSNNRPEDNPQHSGMGKRGAGDRDENFGGTGHTIPNNSE